MFKKLSMPFVSTISAAESPGITAAYGFCLLIFPFAPSDTGLPFALAVAAFPTRPCQSATAFWKWHEETKQFNPLTLPCHTTLLVAGWSGVEGTLHPAALTSWKQAGPKGEINAPVHYERHLATIPPRDSWLCMPAAVADRLALVGGPLTRLNDCSQEHIAETCLPKRLLQHNKRTLLLRHRVQHEALPTRQTVCGVKRKVSCLRAGRRI